MNNLEMLVKVFGSNAISFISLADNNFWEKEFKPQGIELGFLFDSNILSNCDDFYITYDGEVVVDNRENIDPRLEKYRDYIVKSMNYSEGKKAIKIKLLTTKEKLEILEKEVSN